MSEEKKHIAFIDLLGVRRNLSYGQNQYARKKVIALASIAEKIQADYPDVRIHGSGDSFILYSSKATGGWATAQAAIKIFAEFCDLNDQENVKDVSAAYLLRGGLAYGGVEEISKSREGISYSLHLVMV